MTTYVGEVQVISTVATNPITKKPITGLTGFVEFFNPTKNPRQVTADRTPDSSQPVAYDDDSKAYLAYADTTGWVPGRWSYRVVLEGALYNNWEYAQFVLKA